MAVRESIEGNSLTISTYLKGVRLETGERVKIGGAARIDESPWRLTFLLKGEMITTEEEPFAAKTGQRLSINSNQVTATPGCNSHPTFYVIRYHNC